jgi:hypothetical protein
MQIGSSSTSIHVNLKMDLNKQEKPSIATHKNPQKKGNEYEFVFNNKF